MLMRLVDTAICTRSSGPPGAGVCAPPLCGARAAGKAAFGTAPESAGAPGNRWPISFRKSKSHTQRGAVTGAEKPVF